MKNILITGVDGFIASTLKRKLEYWNSYQNYDFNIFGFDEKGYRNGYHRHLKSIDFDCVFHLAAIARTVDCTIDPFGRTFESNICLTNFILKNFSFKKIVYASSCAIYGNQTVFPITENSFPNCPSIYAAQKLYSENLIHFYCQSINKPSVCLRLFNTYGPGQSQMGSYPNVLASLIRKYKRSKSVEITGDGCQSRDFVYVNDVVSAFALASKVDYGNHIYNVCSGVETSINQLASFLTYDINYIPEREFDIKRQVGSFAKIESELGWTPEISLDEGIAKTLDYELRGIK